MGVPQIGLCSVAKKKYFFFLALVGTEPQSTLHILIKHGLEVLEDKVYSSVTEISPFCEARINMYCLTFAPESKKGSNFRNGMLGFGVELTGRVQRP